MIAVEDIRRVDSLKTQSEVDRHIRNMRYEHERHLVEHWLAAWRTERKLPPWFTAPRTSVTGMEVELRRACYRRACDDIQTAMNRHAWMNRARDMDKTTSHKVSGCATV